jgi:hypothetical protein
MNSKKRRDTLKNGAQSNLRNVLKNLELIETKLAKSGAWKMPNILHDGTEQTSILVSMLSSVLQRPVASCGTCQTMKQKICL